MSSRYRPHVKVACVSSCVHPTSGSVVYECRVELVDTRQAWVTFKRAADFRELREALKRGATEHARRSRQLQQQERAERKQQMHELGVNGGSLTTEAAERVMGIDFLLEQVTFPAVSVLLLESGKDAAIRRKRETAFNFFLELAVQLDPLPSEVALFLGLLDDQRMSMMIASGTREAPHLPTAEPHRGGRRRRGGGGGGGRGGGGGGGSGVIRRRGQAKAQGGEVEGQPQDVGYVAMSTAKAVTPLPVAPTYTDPSWLNTSSPFQANPLGSASSGSGAEARVEAGAGAGTSGAYPSRAAVAREQREAKDAEHVSSGGGQGSGGGAAPSDDDDEALTVILSECGDSEADEKQDGLTVGDTAALNGSSCEDEEEKDVGRRHDAGPRDTSLRLLTPSPTRRSSVDRKLLEWEFLRSFLQEVVFAVVRRRQMEADLPTRGRSRGAPAGGTAAAAAAATTTRGGGGGGGGFPAPVYLPVSGDEKDLRISEVLSLNVNLSPEEVVQLLAFCDWGPSQTASLYQDLISAAKGALEPLGASGEALRGGENGGNTCYLDSLIFAMFSRVDAFDWLLVKPLLASDPPYAHLLQMHLRFFVSQLRRNQVIPREQANLLREALIQSGWQGRSGSQEDVSELFCFIMNVFRSPSLPLSEELFHGGYKDSNDSKLTTERVLQLALPSSGSEALTLGLLLRQHFFDNQIHDLNRKVSGEKGEFKVDAWRMVSVLPFYTTQSEILDQVDAHNERHFDRIMLPMVLKRYSHRQAGQADAKAAVPQGQAQTRAGAHAQAHSQGHTQQGRGGRGARGGRGDAPTASAKESVSIPYKLDFSEFVQLPEETPSTPSTTTSSSSSSSSSSSKYRFILVLRSWVSHLGDDLHSGHYVAHTADRRQQQQQQQQEDKKEKDEHDLVKRPPPSSGLGDDVRWLEYDDLSRIGPGKGFVRVIDGVVDMAELFSGDLAHNSYMLFYELIDVQACQESAPLDLDGLAEVLGVHGAEEMARQDRQDRQDSSDARLAREMQHEEHKSAGWWRWK